VSLKTEPRHRRPVTDPTGGAEGNEKLTAMTGGVLLLLLAAEGVTILGLQRTHSMLTLHFFFGFLLVGPVLLKLCSTGYRFVRYYTRSAPYVRKGPPVLLLRILGPVVILTSVAVIGSGIALAFVRNSSLLLLAHKAFFIIWFGATTIHVLWYAPRLPAILASRAGRARERVTVAGAGARRLALAVSIGAGLVLAFAFYHLAGNWTYFMAHRH
jgi:hypothetical protein